MSSSFPIFLLRRNDNTCQFTHVASRSHASFVRDPLAPLISVFGDSRSSAVDLLWLLFTRETDGDRLYFLQVSTPSCKVRHVFTRLGDASHRRRLERSSKSWAGECAWLSSAVVRHFHSLFDSKRRRFNPHEYENWTDNHQLDIRFVIY